MKKIASLIVVLAALICVARAGQVYDRDTAAVSTAGSATWTNTAQYAAIKLARIWIVDSARAADTVTVVRVTSDGLYTQAVGTVTVAASTGNQATFTAGFLEPLDKLVFTASTSSTAMIEFEVQQH